MTGFAFSLATLRTDLHNSGTSLIAAMAIFFKAPIWAPSFWVRFPGVRLWDVDQSGVCSSNSRLNYPDQMLALSMDKLGYFVPVATCLVPSCTKPKMAD